MWVVPMKRLKGARIEWARMHLHYLVGPFGEVEYRNIVMASIYNTLRTTMLDFGYLVCLYETGTFISGESPVCSPWITYYGYFLMLFVYVIVVF